MKGELTKKPQNPTIIEGFPGFGLIGTITTEYFVEHLECEKIGSYWFEELPATIAIHEEKVIDPIGVFYSKKYNIVIIYSISAAQGIDWKAAEVVMDIASQLKAKEIISIEGVGNPAMQATEKTNIFFHTNQKEVQKKLKEMGLQPLKEGIITGVTGALLVKNKMPMTCLFAETHSQMPDSMAAAAVTENIANYLGIAIDVKPLKEKAQQFEEKLKGIMKKTAHAEEESEKKQMSYVG